MEGKQMKKLFTGLTVFALVIAMAVSACPLAFAESVVKVGGITFVINGNTAEVYQYDGAGGSVTIPSKVNGAVVTSIGNYAFAEEYGKTEPSKRITSVSIPDTVRTVGKGAFMECTSLKYIELPMSLTTLGDAVFWYCESLEKAVVFSAVKSMGANVFGRCPKLTVYCESGSVAETYAKSNSVKTKPIYPSKVTVNKASVSLDKGGSAKLTASVYPANCYYKDIIWVSDNASVASVDRNGTVTAKNYGKADIRCYSVLGDAEYTVRISVEVPKVKEITCADRTLTGYTVKWSKVKGASGYRLQKYVNNQWKTVKTTSKTKYTFKDLKEGSSCKYRVRAYIKGGSSKVWGKWSEILTASTKTVSKVTGLTLSKCDSKSLKIKWNKLPDADGYEVYCYNTKSKKYEKIKTTSKTSFTHEDLKAGVKNSYKVRGYMKANGKKIKGKYSSVLTACTAPSKVKNVKAGSATKTTLAVKWSKVKNADGYTVEISGAGLNKTVATNKTSYTFTGLTKNTKYTVKVRAYIACGGKNRYGAYSDKKTFSTNYMPTSVADIAAEFNEALTKTASAKSLYSSRTTEVAAGITSYNISDRYALNTAKALVSNYTGTSVMTADFENGIDKISKIKTAKFFTGNDKVQAFPASAIKKASFKKDGSGFLVTLELKPESVKNNALPQNSSKLAPMIDWKTITQEVSSDAAVSSTATNYTGTTVRAKINKFGRFDTLTVSAPFTARINGRINGKNCNITVQGKKTLDFVITWW